MVRVALIEFKRYSRKSEPASRTCNYEREKPGESLYPMTSINRHSVFGSPEIKLTHSFPQHRRIWVI